MYNEKIKTRRYILIDNYNDDNTTTVFATSAEEAMKLGLKLLGTVYVRCIPYRKNLKVARDSMDSFRNSPYNDYNSSDLDAYAII
jgi:hypothetical protein